MKSANNKNPKKIVCVVGTRPEAIKMAPVILSLKARPDEFKVVTVATAQHRELLDDVLQTFKIKAGYDLNVMQAGQTLFNVTSKVLTRMEGVLRQEKPDMVLVHGDTTTTMAAALASFYLHIPVGHVEAGLRSGDYENPFPEEANRRLADAICTLHFAPTISAKKHLLREKFNPKGIFVTGNTVIDALHAVIASKAKQSHVNKEEIATSPLATRNDTKLSDSKLVLITAHRRENFGEPIQSICMALKTLALQYPGFSWVYSVHPNPNVSIPAKKILSGLPNFYLVPPLSYLEFAMLLKRAHLVITDSGGLQEEAPSLGKPVLVLRRVTERPEAVAAGTVKIIGTDAKTIIKETSRLINNHNAYNKMARAVNPYGDGRAAQRTVEAVRYYFGLRPTRPPEFLL